MNIYLIVSSLYIVEEIRNCSLMEKEESDLTSLFDQLDPASLLPRLRADGDDGVSSEELVSKWKQRLETCRQALEEEVTDDDDDNDNKKLTPEIPIVVVESLARSRLLTTTTLHIWDATADRSRRLFCEKTSMGFDIPIPCGPG